MWNGIELSGLWTSIVGRSMVASHNPQTIYQVYFVDEPYGIYYDKEVMEKVVKKLKRKLPAIRKHCYNVNPQNITVDVEVWVSDGKGTFIKEEKED